MAGGFQFPARPAASYPPEPAPRGDTPGDTVAALRFRSRARSLGVSYALWLLLGSSGAYRFYLGLIGTGVLMLAGSVAALAILVAGGGLVLVEATDLHAVAGLGAALFGLLLLAALALWWLIDGFRIPGLVRRVNDGIMADILGGKGV